MDRRPRLQDNLQAHLLALLSGFPDRRHLLRVVAVCHGLADAFLRSKRSVWSLAARNDLRLSDIAYDCIAELFQQDEGARYVQLGAYFDALPVARMEDGEVLGHLRRLVFAKANHGVFRICNEYDPALGRILRNLKLAIQALRNFAEVERFGELWIHPTLCEPLDHLPAPGREEIVRALRGSVGPGAKIPDLLVVLSRSLREQSSHARLVSLMDVAVSIRFLFAPEETAERHGDGPDLHLERADVRALIKEACSRIKQRMSARYVARGKVSAGDYERYFLVIEQGLLERFVGADGAPCSYFDGLSALLPGLTREEYRERYKSHMEYLGRLALKTAQKALRNHTQGPL